MKHIVVKAPELIFLRGEYVVLDSDAAAYFQVQTRVLNQAVKRNKEKFPSEIMFQVSEEEMDILRSQNVISSSLKYRPFVFTEIGCWTLAMILKSEVANKKGLELLKTFQKMRDYIQQLPANAAPKLLPHRSTTIINVFNSHIDKLMIGDNQVTQNFNSPTEMIPYFEAILKMTQKDDRELKSQLQELIATLKDGQKSSIKDKAALVSDTIQAIANFTPAVAATKTGLSMLMSLLSSL